MGTERRDYEITAENGQPLNATRHAPTDTDTVRGAVILVPAMATPARHYYPLADWFTQQGYVVHTFDYQGYGASARTPLAEVEADILTWADDAAVMLDHVAETEDSVPLHWVGHSLGGQLLAFTDHSKLTQATIMCSGTGYWKLSEGRNRVLAPALWYAIAPTTTRIRGYFPGKRLRILGDLPAPVMRQWAYWCKRPNYMLDVHPEFADSFASLTIPLTSISFTDDETMSAPATRQLESWYVNAQLEPRRYEPSQLGATRITHMGPIKYRNAHIWPELFGHITAGGSGN